MFVMVPGIFGSGPGHWQSRWEASDVAFVRFRPLCWDWPQLDDWQAALTVAVRSAPIPPILVAHSLGCLLVAHWAASPEAMPVAGAFLVSVPDHTAHAFPRAATGFAHPPSARLPFPSLIVASANDPFGTLGHARARAAEWGAGFVELGALGHINDESGLGDWPQGRALLTAFAAGTALSPVAP